MGGRTISTTTAQIANIQLQTSSYGGVIPLLFGTTRIAGNLIWYGNFTPIATTATSSTGGKGLGKTTSKATTYTYSAAVMIALAEGQISGIGAVWKGKDRTTLAALGLTLFTGAQAQAAWGFRTGYAGIPANIAYENAYGYFGQPGVSFANSTVVGYSGTAYLAASAYDLGSSASIPNHGFEVQGLQIYSGTIPDANPAAIVTPFLTNPEYGAGFTTGLLGDLNAFSNYCLATGLFFSPAYTAQRPAADHLKELTDAANTALVWSDGVLKFVPYGDTVVTGNGVTYYPVTAAVYNLTEDNFLGQGDDAVRIQRAAPADAFNRLPVEFLDRANQYNAAIVTVEDHGAVERYTLRTAPVVQAHFICSAPVAKIVGQLMLQNILYKRNLYTFTLPASFALLEPMDIVTLTTGEMNFHPVRIIEIDEDGDDFTCTAESFPLGIASAALYQHDVGMRYQFNYNATPLSCAPPIIFELPADPSATGLSVAIAAGGQTSDPIYGGCRVWLSLDGTNYKSSGIIYGSSRYGTTTAPLNAASGIDTANTLSLTLRSNGQLANGSAADLAKGTTLIVLDGEYLAYQTATLTGVNTYGLTTLNRGLYGTVGAAHASNAAWVRVDAAIARLTNMDLKLIGQTVYIKLTAFNTFQAGEQDLSTVTAYTYTITGNMKALQTPLDFANIVGSTKPDNNATRTNSAGTYVATTAYIKGDFVNSIDGTKVYKAKNDTPAGTALTDTTHFDLFITGGGGAPGQAAYSAYLTNTPIVIVTAADGSGGNYSAATGQMRVFEGFIERTSVATFTQVDSVAWSTISPSGVYTITNPGIDQALVRFDASYSGVTVRLTLPVGKLKTGTAGAAGASAFTLVNVDNTAVLPTKITKISGGNSWTTGSAKSLESYIGGAFMSYVVSSSSVMAGLSLAPGNNTAVDGNFYEKINYALHPSTDNNLYAYESGFGIVLSTSYAVGDVLQVVYSGGFVEYFQNGISRRKVAVPLGMRLYLDATIFNVGYYIGNIAFGPAGAAGANGSNGTNGTNGSNGAAGANAVGFVQDTTPSAGTYAGQMWYAPTAKRLYRWDGSTWSPILGNVSTLDVVGASSIIVSNLQAISANIGTLQTAASGARVVISDNLIQGFYANNVLAFRLGVF